MGKSLSLSSKAGAGGLRVEAWGLKLGAEGGEVCMCIYFVDAIVGG